MICGRGELENAMREHITSLNAQEKVIMLGFRSDVSELLAASNYFVFPSLQEGLPLALMEAMSAGLPCIAANIRGNTDLLGDDYRYLFAPHDVDKLAEMFRSIVNEPSSLGKYCKNVLSRSTLNRLCRSLSQYMPMLKGGVIYEAYTACAYEQHVFRSRKCCVSDNIYVQKR